MNARAIDTMCASLLLSVPTMRDSIPAPHSLRDARSMSSVSRELKCARIALMHTRSNIVRIAVTRNVGIQSASSIRLEWERAEHRAQSHDS
jgi:hypothetical protein